MIFSLEYDNNCHGRNWEGHVLWHPRVNGHNGYNVHNIELKQQLNRADSLTFTINPDHPEYRAIYGNIALNKVLGMTVGLLYDSTNAAPENPDTGVFPRRTFLFYGRCVNIEGDVAGSLSITCEGSLSFLNDILLRPVTFATVRGKYGEDISQNVKDWEGYASYVMNKFNDRMDAYGQCHKRAFTRYEIQTYNYGPNYIISGIGPRTSPSSHGNLGVGKYYTGVDDYMPVMDAINDLLNADNRLASASTAGINQFNEVEVQFRMQALPFWDRVNAVLALDKNIVDISETSNSFDCYTAIIPLDKNKLCKDLTITTSDPLYKKSEYSSGSYAGYYRCEDSIIGDWTDNGYIEKVVEISDIEIDPEHGEEGAEALGRLENRAREILAQNAYRVVREYNVNAVDLALLRCVEREPYTANTPVVPDIPAYEKVLGRTWDNIKMDDDINPIHVTSLHGKIDTNNNTRPCYSGEPVTVSEGDMIIFDDKVYVYDSNSKWVEDSTAIYLNDDVILHENNMIMIGDRVHFTCPELGIVDDDNAPWVCTSLSMSIDNQAATSYTFSLIDTNYIPATNYALSDYVYGINTENRKKQTQVPKQTTDLKNERQPVNVVKIDDNHVVEMYPDREIHYEADGEGDIRTNVWSYEMPVGTTDPSNPWPEPNEEHS